MVRLQMTALMERSERSVPRVQAVSSDILTVGLDEDVYHIPSNFLTLCSHPRVKVIMSFFERPLHELYTLVSAEGPCERRSAEGSLSSTD